MNLQLAEHQSMAEKFSGGKCLHHQLRSLRELWTIKGPRIGFQRTFWLCTLFPELELCAQGACSLCLFHQHANQRHTGTLPAQTGLSILWAANRSEKGFVCKLSAGLAWETSSLWGR